MGRYQNKMAEKNKIDYIKIKKVYIDDFDTYIASTGKGSFIIKGINSTISVDKSGNVRISGATSVKLQGKNLDFSELPDRYIRKSGVSWDWIRNNTEVFGVLPIRIKGQKVYIPFINREID